MRTELLADDTEQFIEKIMEEYLTFRDHFEIYIQTMLSQSLDSSFFTEITNENGLYIQDFECNKTIFFFQTNIFSSLFAQLMR